MSVLSRPQGYPERVWSLVGGLEALSAGLPRDDLVSLINPGPTRGGIVQKAAPNLASDGLGVAYALGVVDREGGQARLATERRAGNAAGFADQVYDILCGADGSDLNGVILEAYAWLVAESHRRQDIGWLFDLGQKEFAEMVDAGLAGRHDEDGGRLMNTTKAPAWRRWLRFLGLGVPMPVGPPDFPSPAHRIAVELARANVEPGVTFSAEEFIGLVAQRCPFLDRGRLFVQACKRIGHAPKPRALSAILSCGLRDLEGEGVISLRLSGDAANGLSLSADPAAVQATFNSVVVLVPETQR